jgi:AraC family ethanolamine operon transcriptional activator
MTRSVKYIAASHADASEQELALKGWHQRYVQQGKGQFRGATTFLDFDGVSVGEERYNVCLAQVSAPPPGKVVLIAHTQGASGRINGQKVDAQLFIHRGGNVIDINDGPDESCGYYAVVDEDALGGIDLRGLPPIAAVDGYPGGNEVANWLSSLIASAPEMLRRSPGALEAVTPGMVIDRVSEICRHVMDPQRQFAIRESYAYALFRRARKRIEDDPDHKLGVADLAASMNVPDHVLRAAFVEATGISPQVWMRNQRLDRARRAMLNPAGAQSSVAEIAMQYGFFHLGRFAAYYAQTFHETPFETLRNVVN